MDVCHTNSDAESGWRRVCWVVCSTEIIVELVRVDALNQDICGH